MTAELNNYYSTMTETELTNLRDSYKYNSHWWNYFNNLIEQEEE